MSVSHRPFGQSRLGLESLESREVPTIAFVGGWGSSAAPSAPGSLGVEVHVARTADPLPVLLVIADQRDFYSTDRDIDGLTSGQGANTAPATPKEFTVTKKTDTSSATGRLEGKGKAFEILSFELGAENTSPASPTGKLYLGTDAGGLFARHR